MDRKANRILSTDTTNEIYRVEIWSHGFKEVH